MQQFNAPQLQMMICGYATEQQVQNWQVAPGYLLVFFDPDGKRIRTKSLQYGTYVAEIKEYRLSEPVAPVVEEKAFASPIQESQDINALRSEMDDLKAMIRDLSEKINKPYYNKKKEGGNDVR